MAGRVVVGAMVGGTLVADVGGDVGDVEPGVDGGTGTSPNTTSPDGTVVATAVGRGAAVVPTGSDVGVVPDTGTVVDVVVVEPASVTGVVAGPVPAPPRSTTFVGGGTESWAPTGGRLALAKLGVRAASLERPAHTSPNDTVPTTRKSSAFVRDVRSVACHQSRTRSVTLGRPNAEFFTMGRPKR